MGRRSERFESPEELDAYLREKTDDIENVQIFVRDVVTYPSGEQERGVGGLLVMCGGDKAVIPLAAMERLINDGVLQKMGIKVRLMRSET